jgi:beta-glucosidase
MQNRPWCLDRGPGGGNGGPVTNDGAGTLRFPPGFVWGGATAAYQIEGAPEVGGRGPSIWDTFSHTPGRTMDGDTGDVAIEHYHRYPQDVALMAELGLTSYRFSISWPRIQPDGTGRALQAGLDFYRRLTDELQAHGIDPWVTLYHWDLPQALEDTGGWTSRDTAQRFADYAVLVHDALSDRVTHWGTLNEPFCSSMLGYASGQHAPGRTEPAAALRAVHHLLLGHGLAVRALRAASGSARLGLTLNLYQVEPASQDPADLDAARRVDGVQNRLFLDPVLRGAYPQDVLDDVRHLGALEPAIHPGDLEVISTPLDLLGVNYYTRHVAGTAASLPQAAQAQAGEPSMWAGSEQVVLAGPGPQFTQGMTERPRTDMDWEVIPSGLHQVLTRLKDEYPPVPIVITENGAAYPDQPGPDGLVHDVDRIGYLDGHLRACHQAIQDGVPLIGYFVWSVFDNYEWAAGYRKRFGVVHVDYTTQVRTPKDSARFYSQVIGSSELPPSPALP